MQLEESLAELRRHFSDEMSAIEATLTRSFEDRPPRPSAPPWQATEPEAVPEADPDEAEPIEWLEAEPVDAAQTEAVPEADSEVAEPIEWLEAEPADQPPEGLRMENLVSGVATK